MTGPAQTPATPNDVRTDGPPSKGGRFASAFPLWDGTGRVLVRPSGTEPALRVMVEGEDGALVTELADTIATLAGDRLN